jgi:hypothetical protein
VIEDGQLRAEALALPVQGGQPLEQTFPAVADGLESVELLLATYGQTADGTLEVRLEAGGEPIGVWRLRAARVPDSEWLRLTLDVPADAAGRRLRLTLAREEVSANAVTAFTSAGDSYPAGEARQAGGALAGDVAFRAVYRPGTAAVVRWRLERTGYPAAVAGLLVVGLFASALAFPYTYLRSRRAGAPRSRARGPAGEHL